MQVQLLSLPHFISESWSILFHDPVALFLFIPLHDDDVSTGLLEKRDMNIWKSSEVGDAKGKEKMKHGMHFLQV